MTMHINLSPEMEGYIKAKVGSGFYGNATEVIRDAIRRMQADEDRGATLRASASAQAAQEEGERFVGELRAKIQGSRRRTADETVGLAHPDILS